MLKIKKYDTVALTETIQSQKVRRLLIVDDEAGILLLLRELFTPYYMVKTAQSGIEGISILQAGFAPQVIIADQRMPGMTGAEFLGESRKIVPDAVRVTLTGYSDIKEIIAGVNNGGIYRFVGKPWEDDELLETVRLCFEQYDLSTKNIELEAALEQVQKLNAEKNEILGIVSHDLKNPISVILGMTELMKPDAAFTLPLSDYQQFAQHLHRTALHMLQLVKALLDDYWLESGVIELSLVAVNLNVLVNFLVENYRQLSAEKKITLYVEASSEYTVLGDERRLNQVLDNLLSNALKYSPLGAQVFVRMREYDSAVRIEIQDQGPGLTEDDKTKLFGKFARLSAQPTGGEHSTGLGLSIVKKMVEAMKGKVWCESEFGQGATFIVELPMVKEV